MSYMNESVCKKRICSNRVQHNNEGPALKMIKEGYVKEDSVGMDVKVFKKKSKKSVILEARAKQKKRIARKKTFCKFFKVVLVSACAIILCGFIPLGSLSKSKADTYVSADQTVTQRKYKVIQIKYGDTLWDIAQENLNPGYEDLYGYIEEIKECNQLESDQITSGHYLMIPYYTYK